MKKRILFAVCAIILLINTGCDLVKIITLPENPLVYEQTTVKCESNNVNYDAIRLDGRVYITYAKFDDSYTNLIGECIGYMDTGSEVPEFYVCTIKGLSDEEYLMVVDAMKHGIPNIYREQSVEGELKFTGIKPYGYPIWDK